MHDATFLFTDIEGSTRLWEEQPERMRPVLAAHDAMLREVVERHDGRVVKMTGDGVHAVFEDALDALLATIALQGEVARLSSHSGLELRVRCGLHAGPSEGRDGDFYGNTVNRAARVMSVAHGGQMLLSAAVEQRLDGRLPEGTTLRDLGRVRLRDLSQPERLLQLVHPALRSDFPALRSLENTPNNLPLELTSFVGREREIAAVGELLAAHRLVSIVGLGGLGKTRLGLQAAADLLGRYPDGAWVVELAPLQDGSRLAQAIATALGVRSEPGMTLEDALARHAADRTLLLILDNCEHLLEPVAAFIKGLLSSAPKMRILTTTREPLRMAGEAVFPLAGLAVPGPRDVLSSDAVHKFESVQLFATRARAAAPDFSLDAANAETVAAICHRLDGIPLAIELAAARVRTVPLQQIATRLKDRFRLLTSGDPTATPRQRTLRATIDWSHDLLPEDERVLFRRLAIFSGGFTLEAAESVCGGEGLAAESVLDSLGRLVEKSLVALSLERERYEMLETVREYARQQLARSTDGSAVELRHFEHFAGLAQGARGWVAEGRGGEAIQRLDTERENLIAALAWAAGGRGHGADGLRMVEALKFYWAHHGLLDLAHRLTAAALDHPENAPASSLRALGLFTLGQYLYFMGRYAESRETLEASIVIARTLAERATLMRAMQTLGLAAIGQGDLATARDALEEAVEMAQEMGDRRVHVGAVNALAMLHRVEGDLGRSEPLYREVVTLARQAGDREAECVGHLNLAMLRAEAADFPAALDAAAAALELAHEVASMQAMHSALEVCAGLAAWRGDDFQAGRFYGAAEALGARTSVKRDAADEAFLLPRINRARAALGPARFEAASRAGAAMPLEQAARAAGDWLLEARAAQAAKA